MTSAAAEPLSIYTPVFSSSSAMIMCPSRVFMNHAHSSDIDDISETQPQSSLPACPPARSSESARSLRQFAQVARTSRRHAFQFRSPSPDRCGRGAWRPVWPAERAAARAVTEDWGSQQSRASRPSVPCFNPVVSAWQVQFEPLPVSAGLLLERDRHTVGFIENSYRRAFCGRSGGSGTHRPTSPPDPAPLAHNHACPCRHERSGAQLRPCSRLCAKSSQPFIE